MNEWSRSSCRPSGLTARWELEPMGSRAWHHHIATSWLGCGPIPTLRQAQLMHVVAAGQKARRRTNSGFGGNVES